MLLIPSCENTRHCRSSQSWVSVRNVVRDIKHNKTPLRSAKDYLCEVALLLLFLKIYLDIYCKIASDHKMIIEEYNVPKEKCK